MKPEELVNEVRIQGLALREVENFGLTGREANDALWVGVRTARAALVEVGITQIVTPDLDQRKRPSCTGCIFYQDYEQGDVCALEDEGHKCIRKGSILVRPPRP